MSADRQSLDHLRAVRRLLRAKVRSLDEDHIRRVPPGFKGNIAWQVGHLAVTPGLLAHGRCGCLHPLSEELVAAFRKGTDPSDGSERYTTAELLDAMDQAVDAIEADHESFGAYQPYETSAGIPLASVDEALRFLVLHDGIHLGYSLALARAAA